MTSEGARGIGSDGKTDGDLLKMLEEQNRLLESDSRYRQSILLNDPVISSHVETTPPTTSTCNDERTQLTHVSSSSLTVGPFNDETKRLDIWGDVMKNWEEIAKKNPKLIRSLVCQGIPGPFRGLAWQLLAGTQCMSLKEQYPSLITESSPFEKSIQRDLSRTFPDHPLFKERDGFGQESLLNLTKAYSLYDREVGYCQGSLFIAGILLMNMPEEEAFCVFVHMMNHYKLRELYKPSMADLAVRFYQLENLVEELLPKLDIHFRALGFHTSMYSSPWFLTLFASTLPLCAAFRIMDIFLTEGMEIVFRIGLALLERSYHQLLQLDLEDMTKHFQRAMKTMTESDCDTLFEAAFKVKITSKKLKKLEKEFIQKKEKQATENSELIRLQDDNVELEKRIVALEKECAALADRLIQGQVTRAQEYEEMYAVRRELNTLRKKVATYERKESKSRSVTPEVHPSKFYSSLTTSNSFRERSTSAPSLRALSLSLNSIEQIKEEESSTAPQNNKDDEVFNTACPSPDIESLLKELATVKIERAECADLLERKTLEMRKLQQKFTKLEKDLQESHQTIESLKEEKVNCPHCSNSIGSTTSSNHTAATVSTAGSSLGIEEVDLQISHLMNSLQNVLNDTTEEGNET